MGDLVGPSSGPLTTISQVDPIKAVVTAGEQGFTEFVTRYPDPEKRAERLRNFEFELILGNGAVYPQKGKFYALDRNIDTRTGSIRFEVTFPNPGNLLRPGQFGRVRVVYARTVAITGGIRRNHRSGKSRRLICAGEGYRAHRSRRPNL